MFHIEVQRVDGAVCCLTERTRHRVDAVGLAVELQGDAAVEDVDVVQETLDGAGKVTHRFGRDPGQPGDLVVTPQRLRITDRAVGHSGRVAGAPGGGVS